MFQFRSSRMIFLTILIYANGATFFTANREEHDETKLEFLQRPKSESNTATSGNNGTSGSLPRRANDETKKFTLHAVKVLPTPFTVTALFANLTSTSINKEDNHQENHCNYTKEQVDMIKCHVLPHDDDDDNNDDDRDADSTVVSTNDHRDNDNDNDNDDDNDGDDDDDDEDDDAGNDDVVAADQTDDVSADDKEISERSTKATKFLTKTTIETSGTESTVIAIKEIESSDDGLIYPPEIFPTDRSVQSIDTADNEIVAKLNHTFYETVSAKYPEFTIVNTTNTEVTNVDVKFHLNHTNSFVHSTTMLVTAAVDNVKSEKSESTVKSVGKNAEVKSMTSGIIALVTVITLAIAVIVAYVSMIAWRRYLEYRYGHRELLVNDLEFDTNDLCHFEL